MSRKVSTVLSGLALTWQWLAPEVRKEKRGGDGIRENERERGGGERREFRLRKNSLFLRSLMRAANSSMRGATYIGFSLSLFFAFF